MVVTVVVVTVVVVVVVVAVWTKRFSRVHCSAAAAGNCHYDFHQKAPPTVLRVSNVASALGDAQDSQDGG